MRFDDTLRTLISQPLASAGERVTAWRQLVDLLAQGRGGEDAPRAYALVRSLRAEVPRAIREEAVHALAGRSVPAALVAALCDDDPAIVGALLGGIRLAPAEWLRVVPSLGPVGRGILRHRRDAAPEVKRALEAFGPSDFMLPPDPNAVPAPVVIEAPAPEAGGVAQISELVARIDAFRRNRPKQGRVPDVEAAAPADEFRFETGSDGVILWVEGAPRGPLIGASIAVAVRGAEHGVDGHAAGAFRRRAPFRDARMLVGGAGAAGGEWRISAVPFFDPTNGRFSGYRGTARRPRPGESALLPGDEAGLFGTGMPPDSLRQLVHELRTPINAIMGFAQMIEHQMLGPASEGYVQKAGEIAAEGRRLLAAVEDLDVAARLESRRWAVEPGSVDAVALLGRLHGDYEPLARERGVGVDLRIAPSLPPLDADAVGVERMFARLLAASIGLARAGEAIPVALAATGDGVVLSVGRPQSLAERGEAELLDPGYTPSGDWPDAPLLGLGFALRLVRNLASADRGSLTIDRNAFVLRLPALGDSSKAGDGSR